MRREGVFGGLMKGVIMGWISLTVLVVVVRAYYREGFCLSGGLSDDVFGNK
jgi:hypothetical protein